MDEKTHKILLSIPLDLWTDLEMERIKIQQQKQSNYQKKDFILDILKGKVYGKEESNR